ncbi:GntR family transcriptional regulator [Salinispira pacifica]
MSTKKSLTQQVYDFVIDQLYSGELRPGDMIDRQSIAGLTGISVGTVLIAINSLEADGFVETIPRKGTLVRRIDFKEAYGQLLVREALECAAARLYAGEPVVNSYDRLLPLAQELDAVVRYNSVSVHRDAEFHTDLIRLTGNPFFVEQYTRIMKLSTFFSFLQFTPEIDQQVRDSHVKLLDRLRKPDPVNAEAALRDHIRRGRPWFFPDQGTGS